MRRSRVANVKRRERRKAEANVGEYEEDLAAATNLKLQAVAAAAARKRRR